MTFLLLNKLFHFIKSLFTTRLPAALLLSSIQIPRSSTIATTRNAITNTSPICPGSPYLKHAKCIMITTFPKPTTCEMVQFEIISRMKGDGGWVDPHNQGMYKLLNTAVNNEEQMSQITGSRTTANGQYTDMFIFTLEDDNSGGNGGTGTGGCVLNGCSESQVFSILDFSTNYCNLRSLYCNSSDDGCPIVKHDFKYEESYVSCWQKDASRCISNGCSEQFTTTTTTGE